MNVKFLIETLRKSLYLQNVIRCILIMLLSAICIFDMNAQCSTTVYDTGGSAGDYSNDQDIATVLDAGAGKLMFITFNSFDMEDGYDFFHVYDGASIAAPLIGTYTGSTAPPDITATGQYLTIRLVSDYIVTAPGYSITTSCLDPPPVPECLAITEDGNGTLFSWSASPAGNTLIGTVGSVNASAIETMCLSYDGQTVYAANAGTFGTINHATGEFTSVATIGDGEGALGTITMDDVDGMAINPTNGLIMAVHRISGDNDIFFVINPITGQVEENYFGPGIDYREIVGALQDMDDIAFHPSTNELFGISTVSTGTTYDQIVLIDQYLGTVSTISNLPTCDIEGLTFNDSGVLFGSTGFEECPGHSTNTIYEIDYSNITGTVTAVTTVSEEDPEAIICYVASVEPCNDIASGGSIGSYQSICSGDDVAAFTNVTSATLNTGGPIEYQWYYSTTSCIAPLNNDSEWIPIAGATNETYDHGVLLEKTCFVRSARAGSCPVYNKNSNVITVDVSPCACPSPTVVSYSITTGYDDVEETEADSMFLTSTSLDMIYDTFLDVGNQKLGLRYNNVNVPSYALIQSAKLVFKAENTNSRPTTLVIEGELAANSSAFNTASGNVSSRNRTVNSSIWSDVETWTAGNMYSSVYITDIISEIIQQGGWNPGNSMSFIITGTGKRVAEAFETSNSTPVELIIEYCTIEVCGDGIDNDGDGYEDSFDPDCPSYAPFNCDKTLYQSISTDNGATYDLYNIETDPIAFNQIYDLSSNGMSASAFNSLAYNPVDRFLYGINPTTAGNYEMYMINDLNAVQYVGNVTGLAGTNDAGCMADDGTYYVSGQSGILYSINTTTLVATQIANLGFASGDMAFNPDDGLLYMWNTNLRQLHSVNPSTGVASAIGSPDHYDEFGALYFNEQGEIIAYGDDTDFAGSDQETLVKIDPTTGVVTPIGTGPDTEENDGCSCAFGVAMTKEASTATANPGDLISYTFTIYNRTGAAVQNVTFEDILPAGLTFGSNPYNISGLSLGSPSIIGSNTANFVISNIPVGESNSFVVDINIPIDFCDDISNQASLLNLDSELGTSILSDDPTTANINDPTIIMVGNCEEYWIESECEEVGANWNVLADPSASRNFYATIAGGNNSLSTAPSGADDRIRFNVTITNAGNYNVFARVHGENSNDDSFWVRANGGTWYKWNSLSTFASAGWEWGQVYDSDSGNALVTFPLVVGANTIDFAYREDGARLDKIKVGLSDELPTGEGGISMNCPEICDNGLDDDGDGLTDCEDDDCSAEVYCQGPCDPGKLFVERWFGINGNVVSDLTSHANYPNSPDELDYIALFQGPNNYADNYGTRVRGFIIPSETGTYSFNVTGDNNTILYLSTDVDEANMSEIASVSAWSGIAEHNKYTTQTSTNIELVANVWYYVELLVKEGAVDDHFQVYWRTPSVPSTWNIIPAGNLAPFICPEICDNGDDDDGDGLEDCLDPDCSNGINISVTSLDNVICAGETATLEAEFTGIPGTLTYAWSDGGGNAATASVNPVVTTTYVVTVTNSGGCTATDQMTVTVNDLPAAGASNDGAITCTNLIVQLTATPIGMTYAWSGGGTGQTKDVATSVTHIVTVTDGNGCSAAATTTVVDDTSPPSANAGIDESICIGESVELIATGGGTYLWEDNTTSDRITVSPIVTTDYSVTVTGSNGCTAIDVVRVNVNALPTPSVSKSGDLQCDNPTVDLTATPAGLTYLWSNAATSQTTTVYSPGTHSVTVTDGNGCSNTAEISVDQNFTPTAISCEQYRVRENGVWGAWTAFGGTCEIEICEGDGLSDIEIDGGPDLNTGWTWYDEDFNIQSDVDEIALFEDLDVDDAGYYAGVYTNQYGCSSSIGINVIVNGAPNADAGTDESICIGESVKLIATGGGTYLWEDNTTLDSITVSPIVTTDYSVTVTGANGCTAIDVVRVNVNALPTPSVSKSGDLQCDNPTVDLTASPAGLTYLWSNAATSQTITVYSPGTHSVTVTDGNGCTNSADIVVDQNFTPTTIFCEQYRVRENGGGWGPWIAFSGTCEIEICEGDGLSDIQIDGGPNLNTGWTWYDEDFNIQSNIDEIGQFEDIDVNDAGYYAGVYTNEYGCSSSIGINVIVNNSPSANAGADETICVGESVKLIATGGGTYLWEDNSTLDSITVSPIVTTDYSVTVSGGVGCTDIDVVRVNVNALPTPSVSKSGDLQCDNPTVDLTATPAGLTYLWSNAATSQTTTIYTPGIHSVTVTDGNGCTNTAQISVDQNFTPTAISCEQYRVRENGVWGAWTAFGGTCEIEICEGDGLSDIEIDGGPDLNTGWTWYDEDFNIQSDVDEIAQFEDIGADDAGYYVGVYTNQYGCSSNIGITVTVNESPTVSASNNGPITCNQTSVTMTALPAGMTYAWQGGGTGQTKSVTVAGTYSVTVTNSDGCTDVASTTIAEDTTPPTADAGSSQEICIGENATLIASGGGTYQWSNSAGNTASVVVSPITTTTYTVIVTAANGCTDEDNITVTVNPLPVASASNDGPITCALPDVTMTALPAGISYAWQGGGTDQTKVVSATGTYSVTVTDANGCTAVASTTVTDDLTPPVANAGSDDLICEGESIDLTASGGVSYQWSNGAGNMATVSVSPIVATTYTVTVTAANGCQDTDDVTISVDAKPSVSITGSDTICIQTTTTLSPNTGGTWQSSDNTIAIVSSAGEVYGLNPGTVSFIFTSSTTGCPSDATGDITVTPDLSVDIDYSGGVCLEDDTQLTANVTGGTSNFTYSWTGPNGFTASTQSIDADESGNYYVTVTDVAGCSDNTSGYLYEEYDPFIFTLSTEICEDETITLSVNSATAEDYQWSTNAGSATSQSVDVTPGVPSEDYYVTVTNDIGCTTAATVHIDVKAKTAVNVTGGDEICIGETTTLSPTTGGTWISSDNSIAGVTNDGTVTGLSAGSVSFTFLDNITNCESNPTTSVTIQPRSTVGITGADVICEGENTTLSPTTGGTWSSNNPTLATVTNDGIVTALSAGTATFVFTNSSTGCVSNATADLTINTTFNTTFTGPSVVCLGDNTYLSPTTGGTWTSSDNSVATISNIGVVTTVGPGTATFTFTSDFSCVSGASDFLVVFPNDVITISGDSELCEDDVITLTASAPGGTWSSSNNSIATVNSSGQVTGIAYGSATITYTHDPFTCANDPEYNITIREKPTASVSGPIEICAGEVTSVTATGTGGIWSSSDESVAIVAVDGTVVGIAAGTATFRYTASNGCESDATLPLTVNPEINVNIDYLGSICLEDDTKLVADVVGGTPDYTYSWSGPGGFTSVEDTIDVTLSGLYNVLVTDGAGCSSNTTAFVYEAYNPFIFTLNTDICEGEDITLSVNGSSGGTYQWSANAGSVTSQTVTVTPPVPSATYYVTVTNTDGCTTVASATIDVDETPVISLIGEDEICVGGTSNFLPSTGGTWSSSDYSVASISNSGIVTALAPGAVTFTYRNTATGCYSAASTSITVSANEDILLSGNNDICMGTPETLTASVLGGTWNSTNNSIVTVSSAGILTPVSAGSATIIYTPQEGTCYNVGMRPINVNNIPTVNVNGPSTICEGEITYLVPSNGGTWVSDDASVATVSNVGVVTGVSGGTANFTFTSTAGCVQTLSTPITVVTNPVVSLTGPSSICIDGTTTLSPTTGGLWISSNTTVATVSSSGQVLGKYPGTAEFTFIEFTNGCTSSDVIEVTVNPTPAINGLIDNTICIGENTNITPATGGTWTSSDPTVATINSAGVITGVSAGAVTFSYTNSSTGCISDASEALTVDGNPAINITGETELCIGDNSSILPNSGGTWSTSDISIATITNDGTITAVSAGDVTFTFTSDNTGCSSSPSGVFTVSNPTNATITGVTNMCIGTVETMVGSTSGTWESSNEAIATVNSGGVVTANAPGIVTITLNTIASCITNPTIDIQVDPNPNPVFTGPSSICIGESTTLSPTTGGVWTSSDDAIATVDNSGNVTSLTSGVVEFTFTDNISGCVSTTSTSLNIYSKPVVSITGSSSICIGENTSMSPSSGGVWTSSDISIATIDANGLVTGISAGSVTFTFTESSTSCESDASLPVTILPKPNATITGTSNLCVGSTSTLSPTTGGSWMSSNTAAATVTDDGIVTAIGSGIAKFTFVSNEGCSSNQTSPIVVFGIPSITIDGPSLLCVGDNVQLLPSSGGTWVTSDASVATIGNDGLVTAVVPGSATFTFTDSTTGCESEASDLITVSPIPSTGLNGPASICIGATTNFTPTTGGVWSSVDPTIASIENNGEVTGTGAGTTRFIFTHLGTGCVSDTTAAIVVTSESTPVFTGLQEICEGDNSSVTPSTGGTWESTNTNVATITDQGIITGIGQGTAKFQFTNSTTGCISTYSASLTVNSVGAVFVDGSSDICIGSTTTLTPSSGGAWTSLNPAVATVTSSGVVTGITSGTANFVFTDAITGCSSDGSLEVTVLNEVGISITGDSEVCIGYTIGLSPNTGGTWVSNNEDIATITSSGIVTGRAPGKVTFTFTDTDSGCVNESTSDSITVVNCKNHDFNVAVVNMEIFGNLSTNDNFPDLATTSYSTPQLMSKPNASIATFNVNSDGSYSFQGSKPGNYRYNVPVCLDPYYTGCPTTMVEFTLVENQYSTGNPVTNIDIATLFENTTGSKPSKGSKSSSGSRASADGIISINTINNDVCIYTVGCNMDWSTAWIDVNASNGNAEIRPNGIIDYTPDPGFIGYDTIYYGMCAEDYSQCNTTMQVVTVNHTTALNTVTASDDFKFTLRGSSVSGNVLENDSDAEGDSIVVTPQGSLMSPIVIAAGEYYFDALGNFNFAPNDAFSGHAEIIYQICDDNADQACMEATLHLLVFDDISIKLRVYLQGALMQNGGATSSTGRPLMRDNLRASPYTGKNYLPLMDPYSVTADPFINIGNHYNKIGPGELAENKEITDSLGVFSVSGDNAIVDWVHVELRSKDDMTAPIATRSGLVQRDGDVVDLDGVSDLRFNSLNVDSFYVVVKHRSHLGVMSEKVFFDDLVDFTSPSYPVYNFGVKGLNDYSGLSQNDYLLPGYSALWAGDFDSNGKIKFTNPDDDQNVLFVDVLFSSPDFLINYDQAYGYMTGDFNMDSKTKYTNPSDDINYLFSQVLLYPLNSSFLSNYNSLIEQIAEEE